jgi:hypothetical protein
VVGIPVADGIGKRLTDRSGISIEPERGKVSLGATGNGENNVAVGR